MKPLSTEDSSIEISLLWNHYLSTEDSSIEVSLLWNHYQLKIALLKFPYYETIIYWR